MSDSLWPHELYPIRPFCPWNFPGRNTRVGCHFLLWGSSQSRDHTYVCCIGRRILYFWAQWEAHTFPAHPCLTSGFPVYPELLNCSSELLLLPSLSVSPPGIWAPWEHTLLFTAVYTQTGRICAMDECNMSLRTTAPRALYVMHFPGGSDSKESPSCSAGDPGSVPGLGRSPGEGNGYPL